MCATATIGILLKIWKYIRMFLMESFCLPLFIFRKKNCRFAALIGRNSLRIFFWSFYVFRFLINVHCLENLSGKGEEASPYCTILKISILPSEKHLKCSKILERCTNPQVKEDFSFSLKDLTGKILRLSVFDVSFQKRHDAIGHALLQLEDAASGLPKKYRIKLYRRSRVRKTCLIP